MRKEFRMKLSSTFGATRPGSKPDNWRRIAGRQWWVSLTGVLVSLLLTLGIVSFVLPAFIPGLGEYSIDTSLPVHGVVGLVLLFELYVIFQQAQLFRVRRQSAQRDERFS